MSTLFPWLIIVPLAVAVLLAHPPSPLAAGTIAVAPLKTEAAQTTAATPETGTGREVVMIDTREYAVPKPWAGNRVAVPADTVANLQRIPPELTLNQGTIYLRNEVIEPLKAMAAAAKKEQVSLVVDSGYRSPRYQRQIFIQFLEKGRTFEQISRSIAPPGYSEHALGIVVDFVPSNPGFATSKAYAWLRRHAAGYGFYEPMSRERRNDLPWEPWHWKFRVPSIQPKPASAATIRPH